VPLPLRASPSNVTSLGSGLVIRVYDSMDGAH